jgi:hypothetical protein
MKEACAVEDDTRRPTSDCSVADCPEPAVVTPRAPAAAEVVDVPDGEIVPLCATHAEEADTPPNPPTPRPGA